MFLTIGYRLVHLGTIHNHQCWVPPSGFWFYWFGMWPGQWEFWKLLRWFSCATKVKTIDVRQFWWGGTLEKYKNASSFVWCWFSFVFFVKAIQGVCSQASSITPPENIRNAESNIYHIRICISYKRQVFKMFLKLKFEKCVYSTFIFLLLCSLHVFPACLSFAVKWTSDITGMEGLSHKLSVHCVHYEFLWLWKYTSNYENNPFVYNFQKIPTGFYQAQCPWWYWIIH